MSQEEDKLETDHQIRIAALRLAIQNKKDIGSRYKISFVASQFEAYIRDGKDFTID
ncbi:hypothetical protein K7A42_02960 [Agrobacterium sp. InxBP2]|uniref:hypothetical protein n=1 Tax=Agrobacterium sp. InxBP2 TaxID=2870329 RepID=UPI00249E6F77|nr:hypothetical protein [Agrobacterium sp. InxBP2]MCW8279834.1 hypothetical protein [Agrobacterium sp. InxBP2]